MEASDAVARSAADCPIDLGAGFTAIAHPEPSGGPDHLAVIHGDVTRRDGTLVRIHRECLAGDIFVSTRCDCRRNMELALTRIVEAGNGVLVYLRGTGTCTAPRELPGSATTAAAILTAHRVRAARLLVDVSAGPLPASVPIADVIPLRDIAPAGLTTREVEVLRLIAGGLVTKQIAERLSISRRTAYHHVEHIYAKIGASTRAAAAAFAVENGLVRPSSQPAEA